MHIKTYQAHNMQEALKQVRKDLGSQAIIVSTKSLGKRRGGNNSRRGVEVVAAIDYDLDMPAREEDDFSRLVEREVHSGKVPVQTADSLWNELKELKELTQHLVRKTGLLNQQHLTGHLLRFSLQLLKQEICEELVVKLLSEIKEDLAPPELGEGKRVRDSLVAKMKREMILAGPLELTPGRAKVAAFVGPTGVGKTTTIAKLAADYALNRKKKVALVSIDTYRIAAIEQLKIYATIMNLPFRAVSSPEELGKTLDKFADMDLVLIDTAGRSQRDYHHIEELKRFLAQKYPVEKYLVMSLTQRENTLDITTRQFDLLPVSRLVFTKLDESCTYGALLNQLSRTKKPLSYFTTGQKVPEDIEIATDERIVSLLLDEGEIHYC